ncbi:SagB/ThcOx family dehydrogenase [Actinophytocola oryzae]|uniref:SagB-type dehydrogenase family enzyme n=1 Tax=Actinophytocola oryzae TaxID=502181 RepID=A0A4R7VUH9_9PSEU|nr:SagB family peptide dehydrogenase [Actinophytocola oryzae]TDV53623.1 SagB-type dehydrogenase family enzyme [Actinophytocola oryzae]
MHIDSGAHLLDQGIPLWSFREDVAIESTEVGLNILTRWGEVRIDRPTAAIDDSLHRMTLGPVALTNVTDLDWADLHDVFRQLPGCVVRSLGLRNSASPLLSATPVTQNARFELPKLDGTQVLRLSRFAFLRDSAGEMTLESPLSHHRVVLHRPLASWVVSALGRTTTTSEVARVVNVAEPLVAEIIAYLVAADMVVHGEEGEALAPAPRFGEDSDPALVTWAPHDLLFHSRSRLGRHDAPVGAGFSGADHLPPLPVVKPPPAGPRFPLYRPDLDAPTVREMTLSSAIEQRRSVREFAEDGPSAEQLGELLYRSARVRSLTDAVGAGLVPYTVSERPYPSAGSLYELDLYLTVDRCAGLPRGIYHYDPDGHALTLVNDRSEHADELLDNAMVLIGATRRPPALITMTARMGRLSWVYDSIAYATTLKHVGVLQQTLYLVATVLGLAPCALATGDDEVATAAFGLDYPAEVSVGEFVVGLPISR